MCAKNDSMQQQGFVSQHWQVVRLMQEKQNISSLHAAKMMNWHIIASFSKHFYAVIVLSIKMYFIRFCNTV
jgi:hypothetical protein